MNASRIPPKFSLSIEPNPVLVKELRGRMRGPRAFLFLTAVLILLGLVSYGLFQLALPRTRFDFNPTAASGALIGQTVFVGLAIITLIVVCAMAPSLTASAISGEYQRKTFDLLLATPLAPFSVLSGKLLAALSYIALVLLAAVPMMSLAYVFGGVTVSDLLKAFVTIGGLAVAYAVFGLFFSALFRRTGAATAASYILLAFCLFGTVFIYLVVGVMRSEQPPNWILALNPLSALASALVDGVVENPNQFSGGNGTLPFLWGISGGRFDTTQAPQTPLWLYAAGIYLWLTIVAFGLATQLVRPMRRFRLSRRAWLVVILFILGSLLAYLLIYSPFTLGSLRAAWLWQTTKERDVVVNSVFGASLDQGWQVPPPTNLSNASGEGAVVQPVILQNAAGRRWIRFWNDQRAAETHSITQTLNLPLPDVAQLRLRVVMRISPHAPEVCGANGDQCPLTVKLAYTDQRGQAREWLQTFFATRSKGSQLPLTCPACANAVRRHQAIPESKWFAYDSPDFFDLDVPQDAPRSIESVSLTTAGNEYEVQITRVSLRLHEGRPLFWTSPRFKKQRWNWRSMVPYWVWNWIPQNGQPFPGRGGPFRIPIFPQPGPPLPRVLPRVVPSPLPTAVPAAPPVFTH